MIKTVTVTNHLGETVILELRSPEKSGFFVRGIEGLGPSKSVVNTTEVLSSDGSFFNSARITSRNLVFDIGFLDDGQESIETIRQKTYRFFPMKRLINIEIETDNRIGVTNGYVETNEPDIFSNKEGTQISVLCPSAFFHEPLPIQSFFTGIESNFEFPFENPSLTEKLIEFGFITIDTQKSVFYNGDEEIGVVIYVTVNGSVNDLTIFNATKGQSMAISSAAIIALTGQDLIAGDVLHISSVKGDKHIHLIRNNVEINLLNAITLINGWFTIDRGDNVFTYTADSGLSNLQLMIEHQTIYRGL